jgi:hypothetical protein
VVNVFVTILYTMEAPVVAVFRQVANTCVVMWRFGSNVVVGAQSGRWQTQARDTSQ